MDGLKIVASEASFVKGNTKIKASTYLLKRNNCVRPGIVQIVLRVRTN
jgi:hypothetical protein